MTKCNDCLANYTGSHTCPPFIKKLVSMKKSNCKTCNKEILKPKKYCNKHCYREALKKRASGVIHS